jgi:hypothetical protein
MDTGPRWARHEEANEAELRGESVVVVIPTKHWSCHEVEGATLVEEESH